MVAKYLDQTIRARGIDIDGVSIGDESDRQTWLVSPEMYQSAAQPIIDAFEMPSPKSEEESIARRDIGDKRVVAALTAIWECLPNPKPSIQQIEARAIEIYGKL